MRHRGWVFLIVLLSLLLLSACGGGSASTSVATGGQVSAPSLEELQDALKAEFDRLGIDPEKVTAKAPQKAENTTFDFAVELDDPDGPGGDPHDGIALSWTERLVGDYNQDGMVTGNDLTPLGQNYSMSTSIPKAKYDDPALHGGITYWPTGDPRGSGALNWRMARVDGNHDGHILLYDITPIAVHWEERLTGYRVWRKPPGGSFELMPDPDDAGSEMTIPRPDASEITNDAPVVYDFLDAQAVAGELGDGVYSYYIEPYDETTSTAGPASAIITIDTATGIVNQSPVAALSVSPNFAGAPAVITLDAQRALTRTAPLRAMSGTSTVTVLRTGQRVRPCRSRAATGR